MHHLNKLLFLTFLFVLLSPNLGAQNACISNPVSVHGDLSVFGPKIIDKNGDIVSFAGNSLFWSNTGFGAERFYNGNVVDWLQEDFEATIVRAAMGVDEFGGYLSDRQGNLQRVEAVVDAAIANGMYVIIDWHSHHAENYRAQSIDFFQQMARKYGNHPNVIYEIYNEPLGVSWSQTIKPYSEAVIAAIRAIDPDNLIIVGTPFFSQEVDVASRNPITGYDNIAYTLHFYAGTHGASLRQRAEIALSNGIALMVTEWGTVNANGDGGVARSSTDEWINFLRENDISHLNWSVHDKNEGASVLRPGASAQGRWSQNDLTASGQFVREIIRDWNQCSDTDSSNSGGSSDSGGGTSNQSSAYPNGVAHAIPGVINATHYDTGGSRVSYSDNDTTNRGNGIRQNEGVDTQFLASAGNVGWINDGEYLEFTVDVATSGLYRVTFDVATLRSSSSRFHLEFNGRNATGTVNVPTTGAWNHFESVVSQGVDLDRGQQTMRLAFDRGSFNISDLEFELEGNSGGSRGGNDTAVNDSGSGGNDTADNNGSSGGNDAPTSGGSNDEGGSNNGGGGGGAPPASSADCVAIDMPFSQDGIGTFCWIVQGDISFVNSWNTDSLTINGVDFTNQYSSSFPEPFDGSFYVIEYTASVPWSHFEIRGSNN